MNVVIFPSRLHEDQDSTVGAAIGNPAVFKRAEYTSACGVKPSYTTQTTRNQKAAGIFAQIADCRLQSFKFRA